VLVGHCAVALAAEPRLSLGTLMAAAVLADLLGIVLILLGIEHWNLKPGGTGSTPWTSIASPGAMDFRRRSSGRGCWPAAISFGGVTSRGLDHLCSRAEPLDSRLRKPQAGYAARTWPLLLAISSLTFFTLLVAGAYWMDRVRKPAG